MVVEEWERALLLDNSDCELMLRVVMGLLELDMIPAALHWTDTYIERCPEASSDPLVVNLAEKLRAVTAQLANAPPTSPEADTPAP